MITDWGFLWVVSDSAEQQQLLQWSIEHAKRIYPEKPRLVVSKDHTLQVDAELKLVEAQHENPECDLCYQLHHSPWERTIFLANRSMVLNRVDHLLEAVPFETPVKSPHNHDYLQCEWRCCNNLISFSREGVTQFNTWLHQTERTWVNSDHILTTWSKHSSVQLNWQLIAEGGQFESYYRELFQGDSRLSACGIRLPHWFQFPVFNLEWDFKRFHELTLTHEWSRLRDPERLSEIIAHTGYVDSPHGG